MTSGEYAAILDYNHAAAIAEAVRRVNDEKSK